MVWGCTLNTELRGCATAVGMRIWLVKGSGVLGLGFRV